MQNIFELNADCYIILQGRIGQGFYGEVYKGILERDGGKDIEPQQVAVKKLKTRALEADLRDFEREISIMKVNQMLSSFFIFLLILFLFTAYSFSLFSYFNFYCADSKTSKCRRNFGCHIRT